MQVDITFSCGHEGTVSVGGPKKDRERQLWYYENRGLCPKCYEEKRNQERLQEAQERAEAVEAATATAKMYGWPELMGSEKQISWAAQLRQEFFMMAQSQAKNPKALAIVDQIMEKTVKASEWIDNRNDWRGFLRQKVQDVGNMPTAEEQVAAAAASIVEPEERTHPGAVEIIVKPSEVRIKYRRDEDLRKIVKGLGYSWAPDCHAWVRDIQKRAGAPVDRAAEAGNALLRAGFSISVENEDARRMAVDATYQPEQKRWILLCVSGKHKGDLSIDFPRGDDDAYYAGRRIAGSRWYSDCIYVPISECDSVLDMANLMHFQVSDSAQAAIDAYKQSVTIAVPAEAVEEREDDVDVSLILESSREVLPDLADED